jgi:hypothetical protein
MWSEEAGIWRLSVHSESQLRLRRCRFSDVVPASCRRASGMGATSGTTETSSLRSSPPAALLLGSGSGKQRVSRGKRKKDKVGHGQNEPFGSSSARTAIERAGRDFPATLRPRAKGSWIKEAAHYRDLHVGDSTAERAFAERFASPDFCIFYDAPTLIVICARPAGPLWPRTAGWPLRT